MKNLLQVFALGAAGCGLCGCASWTAREHQEPLAVVSDPPGAQVMLSNGCTGTTPARFVVPREGDLTATVSKEGYETKVVPIHSSHQINKAGAAVELTLAAAAYPCLVPLLLPLGAQALVSGKVPRATHRPNPVTVQLKPLPAAAPESPHPAGGPPLP